MNKMRLFTKCLLMMLCFNFASCGGSDEESPTQQDEYLTINGLMRIPNAWEYLPIDINITVSETTPAGSTVGCTCTALAVLDCQLDNTVYKYILHSKDCVGLHKDYPEQTKSWFWFSKDMEWMMLEKNGIKFSNWYYQDKGIPMTYKLNFTKRILTLSDGTEYFFGNVESHPDKPIGLMGKDRNTVYYVLWTNPDDEISREFGPLPDYSVAENKKTNP